MRPGNQARRARRQRSLTRLEAEYAALDKSNPESDDPIAKKHSDRLKKRAKEIFGLKANLKLAGFTTLI